MTKREPLKDTAYFENVRQFYQDRVDAYNKDFENKPPEIKRWDNMHLLQYGNYLYLLRALYSLGAPVEELVPVFERLVEHWHAYYTFEGHEPGSKMLVDTYFEALQLCSLAILFRSGKTITSRLEGVMQLYPPDKLLSYYTAYLKLDATAGKKLLFKKSFEPLLEVFEQAGAEEKAKSLEAYLKEWLALMKPLAYTGAHKIKANDTAFAGYWSFESAAACVIEKLDVETFRSITFFPADLADYYKKK